MEVHRFSTAFELVGFSLGETSLSHKGLFLWDSTQKKLQKNIEWKRTDQKFSKHLDYDFQSTNIDKNLYNIYDHLTADNITFDLLVFTDETQFTCMVCKDGKFHKWIENPVFIAAPMHYFDSQNDRNILLGQENPGEINFYVIKSEGLERIETMKINGNLHKKHSSGIIDVIGGLKPMLALEMVNNDINVLEFFDIKNEIIEHKLTIKLGAETSPVVFVNNTENPHVIDILYLSKEKTFYKLIHLKNQMPGADIKKIYSKAKANSFFRKSNSLDASNLANAFEKVTFSLDFQPLAFNSRIERFHAADLKATGKFELFFIKSDSHLTVLTLDKDGLENVEEKYTELLNSNIENIKSVTSADMTNEGGQGLLINHTDSTTGSLVLDYYFIKKIPSDNKVELVCFSGTEKSYHYIPGGTFFIALNNASKSYKVTQSSQTSMPMLQQKGCYIGVGETNFYLTYVFVSAPFTDVNHFNQTCRETVVPTTNTVLFFKNKDTLLFKCYFESPHIDLVVKVLVGTAAFGILILVYLIYLEKKRYQSLTENDQIQKLLRVV